MGLREIIIERMEMLLYACCAVCGKDGVDPIFEVETTQAITDILKLLPKKKKFDSSADTQEISNERVYGYNQALKDVKKALVGDD
jgi:uncharacterized protein YqcC (DUF446 family)